MKGLKFKLTSQPIMNHKTLLGWDIIEILEMRISYTNEIVNKDNDAEHAVSYFYEYICIGYDKDGSSDIFCSDDDELLEEIKAGIYILDI